MPSYSNKTVQVEAIKWEGNAFPAIGCPQWVIDGLLSGSIKISDTTGNSSYLLVTNSSGRVTVGPGDYIVNNAGTIKRWEASAFELVFQATT